MKISSKFKEVEYFGVTVTMNKDHNYLAVDSDGGLHSYKDLPLMTENKIGICNYWAAATGSNTWDYEWCAEVDLEGLDWRETLVKL